MTKLINVVQCTFALMAIALDSGRALDTTGDKNLLWNGSKAKYLGGGWWSIRSYTLADAKSTKSAFSYSSNMVRIVANASKCKECGKPCSILHVYCTDCAPDF